MIDRFDTTEFPTKFAGQITDFDSEGYIDKKADRRYDDCLRYTMVRESPLSCVRRNGFALLLT
jgi:3-oxoacyl-[acyl-carrier-protein] synthase II